MTTMLNSNLALLEWRYADLLLGPYHDGEGTCLATDGYKFAMAQAGFPLREEVFYLHYRKGGPLFIPFDFEEVISSLRPSGGINTYRAQWLTKVNYDWTPAMREAIRQNVTVVSQKKGTWANAHEPILTIKGPSFLVSYLEPLVIAFQFPMQIATAMKDGVRDFTATCSAEGLIIQTVAETLGLQSDVTVTVKKAEYVAGIQSRIQEIKKAVRGDLDRVFEVGTRSMSCMHQHMICLEECKKAGITRTANVLGAYRLGMTPVGTTGHEHQQRHGRDIEGFRAIRDCRPSTAAYLFDTYDPISLGIPQALQAMCEAPDRKHAVRFDSGNQEDQLKLFVDNLKQIDAKIDLSYVFMDGYDARRIASMEDYACSLGVPAERCSYGVGGYLVIDPVLSPYNRNEIAMVYKLCLTGGRPTRKYSGSVSKASIAGYPVVNHFQDGSRLICQSYEQVPNEALTPNYEKPLRPTLSSEETVDTNLHCHNRDIGEIFSSKENDNACFES